MQLTTGLRNYVSGRQHSLSNSEPDRLLITLHKDQIREHRTSNASSVWTHNNAATAKHQLQRVTGDLTAQLMAAVGSRASSVANRTGRRARLCRLSAVVEHIVHSRIELGEGPVSDICLPSSDASLHSRIERGEGPVSVVCLPSSNISFTRVSNWAKGRSPTSVCRRRTHHFTRVSNGAKGRSLSSVCRRRTHPFTRVSNGAKGRSPASVCRRPTYHFSRISSVFLLFTCIFNAHLGLGGRLLLLKHWHFWPVVGECRYILPLRLRFPALGNIILIIKNTRNATLPPAKNLFHGLRGKRYSHS